MELCRGYIQKAITGLHGTLQDLQSLIKNCLSNLHALKARLDPEKPKLIRKLRWQDLKWPLKCTKVEEVIQKLERYKTLFILSLQDKDFEKLEGVVEAQIMDWAMLPLQKSIFWLKGMAGTGKSTISWTVAKSLKNTNQLGASFFFRRGEEDQGNAKKFFLTLTRQLMLRISKLRPGVWKALHNNPDIMLKSLKEQFEKLLLQPLLTLNRFGRQAQALVIKAKSVCLQIFLTSRPELPISLGFLEIRDHEYQDLALYKIPEEVTEHDIHLFLQDQFVKIKRNKNISKDWPGDEVIQKLVKMSAPLFISAATVCRYIKSLKIEPKLRLAELLKDQAKYSDEFEQQQLLQEFQAIVGVIILLAIPLSINVLLLFLGIGADQISNH
ncbi:hypothetical protein BDV11DRAFT_210199 [Aspergillus similis]